MCFCNKLKIRNPIICLVILVIKVTSKLTQLAISKIPRKDRLKHCNEKKNKDTPFGTHIISLKIILFSLVIILFPKSKKEHSTRYVLQCICCHNYSEKSPMTEHVWHFYGIFSLLPYQI